MTVGGGAHRYRAIPGWPDVPAAAAISEAVATGVTSDGRIVVFARGEIPVLLFDADGSFRSGWGTGRFVRPHGMAVATDDTLILVDDLGHSVVRTTLDGEIITVIGPSGIPADTGFVDDDYRTIRPGVGPYHRPTGAALTSDGRIFISDGYGNARVHRFDPSGRLETSWGAPGDGPGEFNLVHGIAATPDDRLIVCDRENSRLAIFSTEGELLETWTDVRRPCDVAVADDGTIAVAELGRRVGVYPFDEAGPVGEGGRISILDATGKVLARWGSGLDPTSPEDMYAPHGICIAGDGSIILAEVVASGRSELGEASRAFPAIRRFEPASTGPDGPGGPAG